MRWLCRMCLLVVAPLSAQSDANSIDIARRFVLAAYPQLGNREASMQILLDSARLDTPWSLPPRLQLRISVPDADNPNHQPQVLANVELFAGPRNAILSFRAMGPLVNSKKWEQLINDVNNHVSWSDAQLMSMLVDQGAMFTPPRVLSPSSVFGPKVRMLRPLLGDVDIESIKFELRDIDRRAHVYWAVTVGGNGYPVYELKYDPIGGELFQLRVEQ